MLFLNLNRFIYSILSTTLPPYQSSALLGAFVASAHSVLDGCRAFVCRIVGFAIFGGVAAHSVGPAISRLIGPLLISLLSSAQLPPKLCDLGDQRCVGWLIAVGDSA